MSLDSYLTDRMRQAAVEREVELIGEAAGRISQAFRDAHSGIPWRKIIAQRNVLAHEYGEIRQDLMWRLVSQELPGLIETLDALLPSPPDSTDDA